LVALLNDLSGSSVENRLGLKSRISGDWYQWDRGGHKRRGKKGEYSGSIMYSYMKIQQ
jgi:hypothetical protein